MFAATSLDLRGMRRTLLFLGLGAFLLAAFTGCDSTPDPEAYTINVQTAPQLGSSTVRVDLVGVSPADWKQLGPYPVSEYFEPMNPVRESLTKQTFIFGEGQPTEQSLPEDADIWDTWLGRGALNLLVIADLPGLHKAKPGVADLRRILVPLDKNKWPSGWFSGTDSIDVRVTDSRLEILTPEKPSKQNSGS